MSNKTSRCNTITNNLTKIIGKDNDKPQDNTIPTWLLACTCNARPCQMQCNARLRPNMLLVINHPHEVHGGDQHYEGQGEKGHECGNSEIARGA